MWEAITGLVSVAKSSKTNLFIIFLIISAVISFLTWTHHEIYTAGYNQHEVDSNKDTEDYIAGKVAEAQGKVDTAIKDSKYWESESGRIQEELDKKPKVIINDVIKFVQNSECRDLGPEFAKLWNNFLKNFID